MPAQCPLESNSEIVAFCSTGACYIPRMSSISPCPCVPYLGLDTCCLLTYLSTKATMEDSSFGHMLLSTVMCYLTNKETIPPFFTQMWLLDMVPILMPWSFYALESLPIRSIVGPALCRVFFIVASCYTAGRAPEEGPFPHGDVFYFSPV